MPSNTCTSWEHLIDENRWPHYVAKHSNDFSELATLLKECGVKVGAELEDNFCDFVLSEVDRLYDASLYPSESWRQIFDELIEKSFKHFQNQLDFLASQSSTICLQFIHIIFREFVEAYVENKNQFEQIKQVAYDIDNISKIFDESRKYVARNLFIYQDQIESRFLKIIKVQAAIRTAVCLHEQIGSFKRGGRLYSLVTARLGHRQSVVSAEDVLQNTTWKMMAKFKFDFDPKNMLSSFNKCLITIAINDTKDIHRKSACEARYLGYCYDDKKLIEELLRHCPSEQDTNDWIWDLVDELPRDFRDVLVLSFLSELPFGKVVQKLNLSPQTVRDRKKKALKILRNKIEFREEFNLKDI